MVLHGPANWWRRNGILPMAHLMAPMATKTIKILITHTCISWTIDHAYTLANTNTHTNTLLSRVLACVSVCLCLCVCVCTRAYTYSDITIFTNIGNFEGAHIKISKILHVGCPDMQCWLEGKCLINLLWPVDLTLCSTCLHWFGQHHYGPQLVVPNHLPKIFYCFWQWT